MATIKVGVYRKWLEPVPNDADGNPMPKELWNKNRRHNWAVRWVGNNGKRYGKIFKTKREAERFAHLTQEKVNKGKADRPKNITIKDFRIEHEKILKGQVSQSSYIEHRYTLRLFENFIGETKLLDKIHTCDAEAFIADKLASKKFAYATINKYHRTLKAIFNRAIDREYIDEGTNPFVKIKPRKVTATPNHYVTVKEFLALLDSAKNKLWWKTFISIAYSSGLRRNEIVHLTWKHVDFVNQRIEVSARKGSDNIIPWEPKGRTNRIVPVSEDALKLLIDMQVNTPEGHPYIFISPKRLKRVLERIDEGSWHDRIEVINGMSRDFEVIRENARVTKCTLHDLRRSAITNWADKLPFQTVHKLAGHKSVKTTMDFYLSVRQEDYQKANNILNEMIEAEFQVTPN